LNELLVPAGITETLRTLAAIHDELDARRLTAMNSRTPGPLLKAERSSEVSCDSTPTG